MIQMGTIAAVRKGRASTHKQLSADVQVTIDGRYAREFGTPSFLTYAQKQESRETRFVDRRTVSHAPLT